MPSSALDASMPSSRTRAPVGEEGEEIGRADGTVAVEVGGAAFARAPTCQQREQIASANAAIAIHVPRACHLEYLELVRAHIHDRRLAAASVIRAASAVSTECATKLVMHHQARQRSLACPCWAFRWSVAQSRVLGDCRSDL